MNTTFLKIFIISIFSAFVFSICSCEKDNENSNNTDIHTVGNDSIYYLWGYSARQNLTKKDSLNNIAPIVETKRYIDETDSCIYSSYYSSCLDTYNHLFRTMFYDKYNNDLMQWIEDNDIYAYELDTINEGLVIRHFKNTSFAYYIPEIENVKISIIPSAECIKEYDDSIFSSIFNYKLIGDLLNDYTTFVFYFKEKKQ